ncbi:MAG: VOC family protein [Nevskia sp.]|nr:VOC family protein [Nevskia sp.]
MIRIKRMVHANLCVADLDRTVAFYEAIGFERFAGHHVEAGADTWRGLGLADGRRFRTAFLKLRGAGFLDGPFLDVIQFLEPPTTGTPYPCLNHAGICRLAFEVEDLAAAVAELSAMGAELLGPVVRNEIAPGVAPRGGDVSFVCFKDPDGNVLEFMQPNRRTSDKAR